MDYVFNTPSYTELSASYSHWLYSVQPFNTVKFWDKCIEYQVLLMLLDP